MRLIFVAPGARAPWTEGRKNLVRDLSRELQNRGNTIDLISGRSSSSQALLMLSALVTLARGIRKEGPDVVVLFPFGRFSRWRGAANRAFCWAVASLARLAGKPLLVALYSVDGLTLTSMPRVFGHVAAVGLQRAGVHPLRLGIEVPAPIHAPVRSSRTRALFLCGYQSPTPGAIASLLDERGLRRLLAACANLDAESMELVIAIPMLINARFRNQLSALASEICPETVITYVSDIEPRQALATHDLFIFPYVTEHEVFIPTSMLEAMTIGVPVVATDRLMYQSLTRLNGVERCILAREDNTNGLAHALHEHLADPQRAERLASSTRQAVLASWTIEGSADDLLAAVGSAMRGRQGRRREPLRT